MALTIYKSGQGYWTRMLSACGAGTLVLAGAAWLWNVLSTTGENAIYIQAGVFVAVVLVAGAILFVVFNKPNIVDFLIATEAEMRKVAWPTRREIIGSTWVVIAGMVLMAIILLATDVAFSEIFKLINVLEGESVLKQFFAGS